MSPAAPSLSGGERQLMLLARALTQQPKLLILDEPTAHLDLHNKHHLIEIMCRLRAQGATLLMTNHEPDVVLAAADDVVVMEAGQPPLFGALAAAAQEAGWRVDGLTSPAIFQDGVKTGIAVQLLRTGERRTLAQLGSSPDHDLPVGKWFFSSRTLAWSAAEFELAPACDLFVVDELGPLEFRRGLGWIQALWALRNSQFRYGLVVIRPDLLQHARAVLPVLGVIGMPDTVLLRDPLDWLLSLR